MKLWMLTEIAGAHAEAVAFVGADDPGEARWLLREKTGRDARVCTEILPEKGIAAMAGLSASEPKGDVPLLVQRPLDRAAEAAGDALSCIREGKVAEARDLLAEARRELDTAERRTDEARLR